MQIYLTATVNAKPEYIEQVKTALQNLVTQSRKEEACIQYDLHQGINDKSLFVFYEIWKNQAGLDAHNQQPYLTAFGDTIAPMLVALPVLQHLSKI